MEIVSLVNTVRMSIFIIVCLVIGDGRVTVAGCVNCHITKELNVDGRSLRYFTL
jgi:hypothetical protein